MRRPRPWTLRPGLLVGGILLLPGRPVAAQDGPAPLTLAEALEIARERSPEYRKALNTLDAAGVQARTGWGAFLPNLTASLSFSGNSATRVTGEDDFGRPVDLPDPVDFQSSAASQSIAASMTLFDGFQNIRNARAAARGHDAAEAAVAAAAAQVEASVSRAFYAALREQNLIALEEQLLASARQQLEATERRFRVAGANQTDVLGAQVTVAQREQSLARQQGAAAKAVLELRTVMGLSEEIDLEPVGEPPAVFDPASLEAAALVARALAVNPQVARLEASAAAAAAQAGAAQGTRWPTITGDVRFSRSVSLQSFEAIGEFNPRNRSLGFGISMNVPLFTRFQTSARVAQAEAQRDNAEEDLRAGTLRLETDVRSALIDLQNAYRSVQLADRSADLARQRLNLAQQRYQLGAMQYTELQLVIDQTAQAERSAVEARYEFARALVTLEERVGEPVRP